MSKEPTKSGAPGKSPGTKAKRKLTRSEKKQIAAAIRQAKGGRKGAHRPADNPLHQLVPGRDMPDNGKEIQQEHCLRGYKLPACTGRRQDR